MDVKGDRFSITSGKSWKDLQAVHPRRLPPDLPWETDWPKLARLVKFRVAGLARLYGKKRAWVWRLWKRECRCSPKVWLEAQRAAAAAPLAAAGLTTKKIAALLCYTDASHLTHDFRRHFGTTIHEFHAKARWQAHQAQRAARRMGDELRPCARAAPA